MKFIQDKLHMTSRFQLPAVLFIPGVEHQWPWKQYCRGTWSSASQDWWSPSQHRTLDLQSMSRIAQMVLPGRSSFLSQYLTLQIHICINTAVRPVLRGTGALCWPPEKGMKRMLILEPVILPTPLAVKSFGCSNERKFAWRCRTHNKHRLRTKYCQITGISSSKLSESELLSMLYGINRHIGVQLPGTLASKYWHGSINQTLTKMPLSPGIH